MELGSYSIRQIGSKTYIDYRKTPKDWLDILISSVIGFGSLAFVIVMIAFTHLKEWIFWIIGILFALVAVIKIYDGISRILQRSRSLVIIDKDLKQLVSFVNPFSQKHFSFSEISSVNFKGTTILTSMRYSTRRTIFATIAITSKKGKSIPILYVNPGNIFSPSIKDVENEEQQIGQLLSKTIASEIGVPHTSTGFEKQYD